MSKVRCAVIGAGSWGTMAHVPALMDHPEAELVAVQHRDRVIAERIAKDFGVPQACTTAEEVLTIDDLDAVVISSIPALHCEQAKAALQRDCHVLIEKPMTITAREAEELVALADAKQLHFIIGATWHYTPHCIEARRIVQSGRLGQLRMISILMTNICQGLYRGESYAEVIAETDDVSGRPEHQPPYLEPGRTSYSDPQLAGGGQIYCQASHPAAYISFLTERQPAEVFAHFENDDAQVDVYDAVNCKLDDGTLVSLATNGAATAKKMHYELRIFGTEGILAQELWQGTLEISDRKGKVQEYDSLPADQIYPMFAPATNLVNTVLGKEENGSPARHGAFAMKLTEAACESSRTGANVKLS